MKKIFAIILLTAIMVSMFVSCKYHNAHEFGEWEITKKATCTKTGLKERSCECGKSETETIPATDHNYVDGVCTMCGQVSYVPTSDEYFIFTELSDGTYSVAAKDIENLPATVVIPSSHNGKPVTVIAENAFGSKIVEREIEYNGTMITVNVTIYCAAMETVILPESINRIENRGFADCINLTGVKMGNSVTHIGDYAFKSCKFKTIDLSNSLTYIGKYAFMCSIESVILPNSLTTISPNAFNSSSLVTITIPKSVTEIGEGAFGLCSFLREIVNNSSVDLSSMAMLSSILEVHSGTSKIVNQNGYLFYEHEGKNLLIRYIGEETNLVLPNSINGKTYEIYMYAFSGLHEITSVVIPEGVEVINYSAFFLCESLEKAYLPKSLTTIYGVPLFGNCHMLTDVYYAGSADDAMAITIIPQKTFANETFYFEDIIETEIHYNHKYK